MTLSLVDRLAYEKQRAARLGRPALMAAVFTSAGLPLSSAPSQLTMTPDRFQSSVVNDYEFQRPESVQIPKTTLPTDVVTTQYDLVDADWNTFLAGRQWATHCYGLLLEFLMPQNAVLPALNFTVTGQDDFGTAMSIPISFRTKAPAPGTRDSGWCCILPNTIFNSMATYRPFCLRPLFTGTPATRAVITCTFTVRPVAGTTLTYTPLLRGSPAIDELAQAYYRRMDVLNRAAAVSAVRAGDIEVMPSPGRNYDFDVTYENS